MSRLSTLLFSQSPLPILIVGAEGLTVSEGNAAAGRLFKRDITEFQDLPLKDLCAFGEFARLKEVLSRGSGPHTMGLKLLRSNNGKGGGGPFFGEVRANLMDSGGEMEWLVFCRDVTSEHEATEALRRSEREYRRMVENSPDGMALIQDGLIVFANGSAERLLGASSPDQLWAVEFRKFVHEEDLPHWVGREKSVLSGNEPPLADLRFVRLDGKVVDMEVAVFRLQRPEGWALQVTLRDISKRKQMESRIKESEERYKGLADVAFDGVAVHFEGVILNANRSFDLIFGYKEGDTKGRSIYDFLSAEHREIFKAELNSGNVLEMEGVRENGSIIHVDASTRACTYLGDPAFVTAVRDISTRKNAEQLIRHQAHYDTLTGLPNRLLFHDRLGVAIAHAKREKSPLAVLFLDLDRFKPINDALGHHVGDLLLKQVADRLSECLRKGDTVSRLGGDEFTVLLSEINDPQDAYTVSEKIIEALNLPFEVMGKGMNIGVSIGISLFPEHAQEIDQLIKFADQAMYASKEGGRNQFQLFEPSGTGKHRDRLGLESQLRRALENKEFTVYYQPKIDLKTGKPCGAEALVRWNHKELGIIRPDEFIPLAEETRLIVPLGEWVFLHTCRQIRDWKEAGLPSLPISVNLSVWQLHRISLIETVDAAMELTHVDPSLLELEITENVAMKNPEVTLSMLQVLTSRGLKISLDDFGKAYSSLNYLAQFPVSTIKIDQSFVRGLSHGEKAEAIIRSVIQLSHNLGLKALAEGVENEAELNFLKEEGCDYVQGFYFAKPMPPDEYVAWMKKF